MADLMRVSILGTFPGGEEWSINPIFALGYPGGLINVSPTMAQSVATAVAARAVSTGLLQMINNSSYVTGCRVEARKKTGELEAQAEAYKASPTVGSGTAAHPFQTSGVFSLRTSTVGARGRGRLYWPATGVSLTGTTLRFSAANVTSWLANFKTYMSGIETDIDTVVGGGADLAVWSRAGNSLALVNEVRMGDVADVQRRRRDLLVESYSSTPFP